ncbi:MAG: hypothetical protein IRZ21_06360 [Thermoleophilaceae bacterium]|nr:hypothetical protein [Thermoleophilaceae bacterium]
MAHRAFRDLDDGELLELFLEHREAGDPDARQRAQLAWSVLTARHIDRVRSYVVVSLHRNGGAGSNVAVRDEAVRLAVARLLALAPSFAGGSLGDFRRAVRRAAKLACADALAGKKR